jgi:hypothetical protein
MREISRLDLTGEQYTVEQSSVRNKYRAEDAEGNTVLRGNHEMFEANDEFHFTDGDDTEVCTVEASKAIDVAANYHLVDSETGEEVAIFDNDFSILRDTWRVRDATTESVVAEIRSRGTLYTLASKLPPFAQLLPRKFEITDSMDTPAGSIDGQLSLQDRYEISFDESTATPKAPIVACTMVIDAIQGE